MTRYCKQNLLETRALIAQLSEEQYSMPSTMLSGATIGQHLRHILEFYLCLLDATTDTVVNYDNRARNRIIETNLLVAVDAIDYIVSALDTFTRSDDPVMLQSNFEPKAAQTVSIPSSYARELAYNLEHSIHHQALIKVGLKEQGLEHLLDEAFGVAPTTIRFKQTLA